jgi:hypothetical protein
MNYHINTNDGVHAFAGETKDEAEMYAKMSGFEIVAPTVKAHYFETVFVGGGEVMPFSGDIMDAAIETHKVEVAV